MTPQHIKDAAIAYVESTRGQEGRVDTYIAGATAENSRAQGLVDDIQLMIDQFELSPEESWFTIAHKIKGIALDSLRKWKGEVEPIADDKCRCIQPNWNAFTGKCLTCDKS